MEDLIFKSTPWGDVTVSGSWPEYQRQMWLGPLAAAGCKPQRKPFVPTYEAHQVSWPGNDGVMQFAPINPHYTPTRETADALATMYAVNGVALRVIEVPFLQGGPMVSTAVQRVLVWPNGGSIAAGQLAKFYTQNPEDKFPGLADKLCREEIAKVWK